MIESRSYKEEDIRIVKGDTFVPLIFSCYDEEGSEYDLTNANVEFSVLSNRGDTTPVISKTETDGISVEGNLVTINSFIVTLSEKTYYYSVNVTTEGGTITTIAKGKFIVEGEV